MELLISIVHVLISLGLIILILLQTSEGGLGSAFGGGMVFHTKRGVEKVMMYATVILAFLFTATSVLNVVL